MDSVEQSIWFACCSFQFVVRCSSLRNNGRTIKQLADEDVGTPMTDTVNSSHSSTIAFTRCSAFLYIRRRPTTGWPKQLALPQLNYRVKFIYLLCTSYMTVHINAIKTTIKPER